MARHYFESDQALHDYLGANRDLKHLRIEDSPRITLVPPLPSTVEFLQIVNCVCLTEFAVVHEGLVELRIYDCPGLTSLPKMPQTLEDIRIFNCAGLHTADIHQG